MQEKAFWQRMHQEIFFLPTKIKLQVCEPANDGLRNFSLKDSSFDLTDQVMSILSFFKP